jgi:hypothetical protein
MLPTAKRESRSTKTCATLLVDGPGQGSGGKRAYPAAAPDNLPSRQIARNQSSGHALCPASLRELGMDSIIYLVGLVVVVMLVLSLLGLR